MISCLDFDFVKDNYSDLSIFEFVGDSGWFYSTGKGIYRKDYFYSSYYHIPTGTFWLLAFDERGLLQHWLYPAESIKKATPNIMEKFAWLMNL